MRILVTNDDGIDAPGLLALIEAVKGLGHLTIVAPSYERSAASHSITLFTPIELKKVSINGQIAWSCSGTPADCVKVGFSELMDSPPDLVVSGINKGSNTGQNILYSGTVSAAVESMFNGVPSIAFSITSCDVNNYDPAIEIAKRIIKNMLKIGLPSHLVLNVNIPPIPIKKIKGLRITRQSQSKYKDYFNKMTNTTLQKYKLDGSLEIIRDDDENDDNCVEDGWVSMTPLQFNLTDFNLYNVLKIRESEL